MKHNLVYKFTIAISILVATTGSHALAQQAKNLPLPEAIKMSLTNSGQIKIANFKVAEANANYHEAKDNYLPDLKVTGSYLRLNSPNIDLKVKLGSSSGGSSSKPGAVDHAVYGMLNLSLPVFSGFRIKYGVEAAKYMAEAAKLDVENDREDVINTTIQAYSNLFKARNSVDMVGENLAREEQRIKDFTNLTKNGLMSRNDLLKAELQKSNIELALLDAKNNLKMATVSMNLLLGLPENTDLIPDTSILLNTGDPGPIMQWEQTALTNRKDAAALAVREKASESAIKATKGQYYPGIAITGGLIAADVPNLLVINNAMNIGLGLQYNIASIWKTPAKLEQATARLHQVQATQNILNDGIRLQVTKAYQDYLLSSKKIEVYAHAIEQANENYRITKNKHTNSLATTTELLEADVAQLQAMLNFSFSKVDAAVAYFKLQQTAGILEKK